jgi:hypothetical protein
MPTVHVYMTPFRHRQVSPNDEFSPAGGSLAGCISLICCRASSSLQMLYLLGSAQFHSFLSFGSSICYVMMAQEGSIDLPVMYPIPPIASEALGGQQIKINILPQITALQPMNTHDPILLNVIKEDSGAKASDDNDDEVQFVFSAPRRRKRKRKRYAVLQFLESSLTTIADSNSHTPRLCSINVPSLQQSHRQEVIARPLAILGAKVWEF